MLDSWFQSIVVSDTTTSFSLNTFIICTAVSLGLGVLIASIYMFRNSYTKGFVVTLALMPAIVQMVIMLVNGNLGAGVAVMGAFSLVRFRSAPGTAREISSIFLAMAVGLATGMGYLAIAVLFVAVLGIASIVFTVSPFGAGNVLERSLRITIPESLDYTEVFDDIFNKYLKKWLFDESGNNELFVLMITRLVPLFPYNLQNFAYGVTDIPFLTYSVYSFVFMLPGTAMYTVGTAGLAHRENRVLYFFITAVLASAVIGLGVFFKKRYVLQESEERLEDEREIQDKRQR